MIVLLALFQRLLVVIRRVKRQKDEWCFAENSVNPSLILLSFAYLSLTFDFYILLSLGTYSVL